MDLFDDTNPYYQQAVLDPREIAEPLGEKDIDLTSLDNHQGTQRAAGGDQQIRIPYVTPEVVEIKSQKADDLGLAQKLCASIQRAELVVSNIEGFFGLKSEIDQLQTLRQTILQSNAKNVKVHSQENNEQTLENENLSDEARYLRELQRMRSEWTSQRELIKVGENHNGRFLLPATVINYKEQASIIKQSNFVSESFHVLLIGDDMAWIEYVQYLVWLELPGLSCHPTIVQLKSENSTNSADEAPNKTFTCIQIDPVKNSQNLLTVGEMITKAGKQNDPGFTGPDLVIITLPENEQQSINPCEWELQNFNTILPWLILSLAYLGDGASCIVQLDTLFHPKTCFLIYILRMAFEQVTLIRTAATFPLDFTQFVICQGFRKSCGRSLSDDLERNFEKLKESNNYPFDLKILTKDIAFISILENIQRKSIVKWRHYLRNANIDLTFSLKALSQTVPQSLSQWKLGKTEDIVQPDARIDSNVKRTVSQDLLGRNADLATGEQIESKKINDLLKAFQMPSKQQTKSRSRHHKQKLDDSADKEKLTLEQFLAKVSSKKIKK